MRDGVVRQSAVSLPSLGSARLRMPAQAVPDRGTQSTTNRRCDTLVQQLQARQLSCHDLMVGRGGKGEGALFASAFWSALLLFQEQEENPEA